MRNITTRFGLIFVCASSVLIGAAGCKEDEPAKKNLHGGFISLESQQYDAAQSQADANLAKSTQGPGTVESLYLKGRAIEQRPKASADQARADLTQARQLYEEALRQNPPQPLEAYVRASLGNVAYWQDDYSTAMQQWSQSYEKLDEKDETRPFVLYRIGLCQQRLGQFPAADKTFATVQQTFPQTEAADRAKSHTGYKFFIVQLATFANQQAADVAINDLRRMGANPNRIVDARGRHVVNVGPAQTYVAAQQLKTRFSAKFPDAVILP